MWIARQQQLLTQVSRNVVSTLRERLKTDLRPTFNLKERFDRFTDSEIVK
jgi:hypothetical protein